MTHADTPLFITQTMTHLLPHSNSSHISIILCDCPSKTNAARCMKIQSVPRVLPIQLKRFGYTLEIDHQQQSSSSSSSSFSSSSSSSASSLSVAAETMADFYRRSPFSNQPSASIHSHPSIPTMNDVNDALDRGDNDHDYHRRGEGEVGVGVGVDSDSMDVTDTDTGTSSSIIFIDNDGEATNNTNNNNGVGGNREVVTMKPYKLSHLVEYPQVNYPPPPLLYCRIKI